MSYLLTLAFGLFISVAYGLSWSSNEFEKNTSLQAEIKVNYFIAYRNALIDYLSANNSMMNGTIQSNALIWPHATSIDANWTNVIVDGKLYVYSTAPASPGLLYVLQKQVPESLFLGQKMASGHLKTLSGEEVMFDLPNQIPIGAIVFVGD